MLDGDCGQFVDFSTVTLLTQTALCIAKSRYNQDGYQELLLNANFLFSPCYISKGNS